MPNLSKSLSRSLSKNNSKLLQEKIKNISDPLEISLDKKLENQLEENGEIDREYGITLGIGNNNFTLTNKKIGIGVDILGIGFSVNTENGGTLGIDLGIIGVEMNVEGGGKLSYLWGLYDIEVEKEGCTYVKKYFISNVYVKTEIQLIPDCREEEDESKKEPDEIFETEEGDSFEAREIKAPSGSALVGFHRTTTLQSAILSSDGKSLELLPPKTGNRFIPIPGVNIAILMKRGWRTALGWKHRINGPIPRRSMYEDGKFYYLPWTTILLEYTNPRTTDLKLRQARRDGEVILSYTLDSFSFVFRDYQGRPRRTPGNELPPSYGVRRTNNNRNKSKKMEECCFTELDRLILLKVAEVTGALNDYPVRTPKTLQGESDERVTINSTPQYIAHLQSILDETLGQYPITLQIPDIDPTKPGEQKSEPVNIPNISEALAEIYGLQMQEMINNREKRLEYGTAMEIELVKRNLFQTKYLIESIIDYLGFDTQTAKKEVKFSFNWKDPDQFLEQYKEEVEVEEFNENKKNPSLQTILDKILIAAQSVQKAFNIPIDPLNVAGSLINFFKGVTGESEKDKIEKLKDFIESGQLNNDSIGVSDNPKLRIPTSEEKNRR